MTTFNNPSHDINFFNSKNIGKGGSLAKGFALATGSITIIQDADLEYDPAEYEKLINPILSGKADVVYGSRFIGEEPHRVLYFWHRVGNGFLTLLSNILTDINLTDVAFINCVKPNSVAQFGADVIVYINSNATTAFLNINDATSALGFTGNYFGSSGSISFSLIYRST